MPGTTTVKEICITGMFGIVASHLSGMFGIVASHLRPTKASIPGFVQNLAISPSLSTVKTYAQERDFNVTCPVMEWHQRNDGGNSKITEMFTRYFRFPESFEQFLYLSQVQQAVAIKTASEYLRSTKPVCMGILYWQLNDVWPVASWSSIDAGNSCTTMPSVSLLL